MAEFQPMPTATTTSTDRFNNGLPKTRGSFPFSGTKPTGRPSGFPQFGSPFTMGNGTRPPFFPPGRFRDPSDTNQAPTLLGVGGTLLFISICLLVARLWSRTRRANRLKMDDWTLLGATVLAIAQYALIAAAVFNGLGRRAIFVPAAQRSTALRLLFISQLFWYWSVTLVKLSVASLLLRFKHTTRWRFFLYTIMLIATAAAIVQTCFQFLQCRPFSAYWDPRVSKSVMCFRRSIINGNIIVFSSIQVALDIIFTFIPITFIRKLKRPRREKIFMCVLMCFGLLASCAAVVRTLTLQEYYTSNDIFRTNVSIALWTVLEQHLALFAATLPTLKAFMERAALRVGLWFYNVESEKQVRGELVKMGLIDEKETIVDIRKEVLAVERPGASDQTVGTERGTKSGGTDQWGGEGDGEKEVSLEVLGMSARAKEFV